MNLFPASSQVLHSTTQLALPLPRHRHPLLGKGHVDVAPRTHTHSLAHSPAEAELLMMKGPLLTHVEKSSSDPRWEESMDISSRLTPSLHSQPQPPPSAQCLKPVALVFTTSHCHFTTALCQQPCGRPFLAGYLSRVHSCWPGGTFLAELLPASEETKQALLLPRPWCPGHPPEGQGTSTIQW